MNDNICKPRSQYHQDVMEHDYTVYLGEEGDNGFHHEVHKCAYCGHVDMELTPEEAGEQFVRELLDGGEIYLSDISKEMQRRLGVVVDDA